MHFVPILTALLTAALAAAQPRSAQVYIHPISSSSKPAPLAEIAYDTAALSSSASVISYEAPELPESSELIRIGLYDTKSSQWISGTTVASTENFSKGYAPHFVLSVDSRGEVISTALKGVRIDAGQTRDFGPQATLLVESKGKQPELNKPVVLSPEGKKVEEEEKSFFQKYWWMIGIAVFVLMGSGGAEK
uniref:ER membrane protein complex subunit 10 n=1 Tax=Bionectria ochroleuca TaxID=29856 RepID=A0A8H7TNS2_BIOOC